jgi:hypothetical protein
MPSATNRSSSEKTMMNPKTNHDHSRTLQCGAVSLLVLVATIPLVLALGAMLTLSVAHHAQAEQSLGQSTAAMTSFAGAQDALARLEEARTFNGQFDLAINGGTAHVSGAPWLGDGIDNDKNGLVDDAEEKNIFAFHSDGWLNATAAGETNAAARSYHATTDVVAEVVDFDFSFGQAIYIDDPKAKINLNGGAFELSGNDENLDGSKGPDSSRPAVGVNGDPSGVISQVAKNQRAKIVGNLPDPAIGKTDALDFDKYETMLAPLATMNWTGANDSYSGTLGDYSNRKGIIAHATGNLKLHGGTTGAGILIVDGDLELDGKFQFAGLIIVRGNVSFQGGGAPQELFGALLLWGKDPPGAPTDDLRVNGSVQVAYSSQGLGIASTTGGVRVMFWREQ